MQVYKGIVEDRNDPLKLGRCRVRVIGYHTENKNDLPTEDLPWATPMLPVTSGAMNGLGFSPNNIVEGTTVLLIFNDGDEMQDPIIIGAIGGIIEKPNYATKSDMKTDTEDQKAVLNDGIKEDGNKTEPLQKLSEIGNRQIDMLVIHATATKPNQDIGVVEIDDWHRQRGWREIGYHAVIRRNGVIEQGRDITKQGAHAKGYNRKSIGVALVGGVDENLNPQNNFTQAQWQSLKTYVQDFIKQFPKAKIIGHNQISSKACPCFDVPNWLDSVFDDNIANEDDLKSYDENAKIDGIEQEKTDENKDDVAETEGFADDVVKGKANTNNKFSSNSFGFNDPNGVYPKTTHLNEPDVNRWARNENIRKIGTWQYTINPERLDGLPSFLTANNITINIPKSPYNAVYPYNRVYESESGHLMEIDDTPNAERLLQFHRSGTYHEIYPKGDSVVMIIGNDYKIVKQDDNLYVQGNLNITIDNDCNLKINGKANIEVKNDVNINTENNMSLQAKGNIDIVSDNNMTLKATRIDLNP